MRTVARRLALFASAVAAVASCDDGKTPAAPLGLREFRDRLVAVYCRVEVACEGSPDMATCLASVQEQAGFYATLEQDIASGKVAYDAVGARRCVELMEQFSSCKRSELEPIGRQVAEFGEFCTRVFTGTVAPGGSCFVPEECIGDDYCSRTDPLCSRTRECCAATCVAVTTPIAVGGDCSAPMPNQGCASGSFCMTGPSGTQFCALPATVEGAACTADRCAAPLYCDVGANGQGTCKPVRQTGEACNPMANGCDDGRDTCDDTTSVCTRKPRVGATCDPLQYNCVGYATCVGTTCTKRPTAGEACPTTGPNCLGGLTCDAGTCTLYPPTGACS